MTGCDAWLSNVYQAMTGCDVRLSNVYQAVVMCDYLMCTMLPGCIIG